jgi:hypothetical protein
MGEFTAVALGFPTVCYGGALVVVVGYWGLVLIGAADSHGPGHHGHFAPAHHGHRSHVNLPAAAGLGGVPMIVALSLLTALTWFVSLVGSVALDAAGLPGGLRLAASVVLLPAAVLGGWPLTWTLVRPLRHLFPEERSPSRADFVGQVCVIRTGTVTDRFGQAEVAAPDGSTAIVQVRCEGPPGDDDPDPPLTAGSTALLYAYDDEGEFFRAAPFAVPDLD